MGFDELNVLGDASSDSGNTTGDGFNLDLPSTENWLDGALTQRSDALFEGWKEKLMPTLEWMKGNLPDILKMAADMLGDQRMAYAGNSGITGGKGSGAPFIGSGVTSHPTPGDNVTINGATYTPGADGQNVKVTNVDGTFSLQAMGGAGGGAATGGNGSAGGDGYAVLPSSYDAGIGGAGADGAPGAVGENYGCGGNGGDGGGGGGGGGVAFPIPDEGMVLKKSGVGGAAGNGGVGGTGAPGAVIIYY